MNILYIEHYAGSPSYGMEFRPYYLAKEWVKQGHTVTIIAASFSHMRQNNPDIRRDFQEEMVDGIKYVWFKTPSYKGSLARIWNILTFVTKLWCNVNKIAKLYTPNVVIASSTYPIDNIPANRIAKAAKAKYIYEIHDLWPLSPMLIGGYSKYHPFIMTMQWGENYAYKHVDKVVSLLWNSEKHCKEHGLPEGKFVCVPNGYDPNEWSDEARIKPLPQEHAVFFNNIPENKIIVGCAGSFVASCSMDVFVEVANVLKNDDCFIFVLIGKGPEEQKLRKRAEELSLVNLFFLPAVPKKSVPSLISHFDIAYMGGVHSILHSYGTSINKVTDYMLSSKPIVDSHDEPGSVVERTNCGIRVEAENPRLAADAILKIASLSEEERKEMGDRGRKYVETNLKWSVLAEKFIKKMEVE